MYSIKNIFTFASHIPGNKVLRLILWIQVIMILFKIVNLVIYTRGLRNTIFTRDLNWFIPLLIFYLTYALLPTYILWKGIKLSSKSLLGWFIIIKLSLLFIRIVLIPINKYYGPLQGFDPSRFEFNLNIIISIIITVLSLYTIWVVYIYYKKLESPVTTLLYYQCQKMKENESTREIQSDDSEIIDSTKSFNNNGFKNSSRVSYHLENFILNPFDVTIDTGKVIGEGQFGTVYKGSFRRKGKKNLKIAAKVAKDVASSETLDMIFQEIKILICVGDHENIIKFYGVTSDGSIDNHVAIISEYMSFGCLKNFLQDNRHTFQDLRRNSLIGVHSNAPQQHVYLNLEKHGTHSTNDLMTLSKDIAKGMEHLASKKIVHGDLACRNVLVTKDLRAKLTDFGMSRRLYAYQVYSSASEQKCNLPWRWMSIEAIEDLSLSEKSDVWSYGVTLWEIFTLGEFPFDNLEWSLDIPRQIRLGLLKLSKPKYSNCEIFNSINECCNIDPCERPTFLDLRIKFEKIEKNNS